MSHDTLAIIWFGLWGLIWTIYFILDAYSLGIGMLFPFLTENRKERNQLQESIGPFWGGNEVWLITAGGATFAAFPLIYANMFSFLYTPLMLILFALFFRAVGLEFMHKDDAPLWQSFWKWAFFGGSVAIALLFGVAFANLFYGLKITENGYEGTLLSLLHPYGLLGGILFISLFLLSGSLWITLKTEGPIAEKAAKVANRVWFAAAAIMAIFMVATNNRTPIFANFTENLVLWVIPIVGLVSILIVKLFLSKNKNGMAFTFVSLSIFSIMATGFIGMFPNMLPSKISEAYSITLYDAAGSALNLQIMLIVAIIFVPIVISYQLWSYTIFKKKITKETAKGYQ